MKCAMCDRKIPKERLKAVPDTEYCVTCAGSLQSKRKASFVPIPSDACIVIESVMPVQPLMDRNDARNGG